MWTLEMRLDTGASVTLTFKTEELADEACAVLLLSPTVTTTKVMGPDGEFAWDGAYHEDFVYPNG